MWRPFGVRALLPLFLLWMGTGPSLGTVPGTNALLPTPDAIRKELVKATILQRLGLSAKPSLDPTHQISHHVVLETLKRTEELEAENQSSLPGLFRRAGNESENETNPHPPNRFAKTSQIISFPDRGPVLNGQPLLSFSLAGESAVGVGVRVKRATLWLKMDYRTSVGRDFPHLLHTKPVTLYVFTVAGNFSQTHQSTPPILRTQDVSLELALSQTLPSGAVGWQKLDLTGLVSKWYGRGGRHRVRHQHQHAISGRAGSKLTLLVDCSGCLNSIYPVTFGTPPPDTDPSPPTPDPPQGNGTDGSMPFLALETESGQGAKRNRRRALECTESVRTCCKQRFFISFQDLGWDDWIIAPRGYYANYCRGSCGGAHRTPDTFLNYHTHVMEEYRRTEAGRVELSGLTPCCAPTKFSPMSLIYFSPDFNIIKRDLPRMIVEECGCP